MSDQLPPNSNTSDDATRVTPKTINESRVLKDRFVLLCEIGRGGMGVVWKALDKRREETQDSDPYVAIKLINANVKQIENSDIALQREAKKSQKLAHPNIATVYDFDRDGDDAFISMELLDGEPLSSLIEKNPQGVGREKALHIIYEMAKGLAFAHSKNLVHSDFKPGNVFINADGSVKILDFGIARAIATENEQTHATVFDPSSWNAITPAYASPEMFKGEAPDPRDDIYALGCVSYQLLCGKHPFNKAPSLELEKSKLSFPKLTGLSREAKQTLQKSVALSRKDRIQSAEEFLNGFPNWNRKKHTSSLTLALLATSVLCLVTVSIYVFEFRNNNAEIPINERWQHAVAPPPESQKDKIQSLLRAAKAHASIGRYISPKAANAAEAYMAILNIHPGNKEALEGANRIAESIIDEAKVLGREGQQDAALLKVTEAEKILEQHPQLLKYLKKHKP